MQLIALSNLLFVDAEFSEDRAKGGADKEAPLVVFFFWKCEKKKTQTFRYSPLSSWFIFFIVFHCLIKERQHMLKEIRYMSGSEMMSIILHLAVLLSGKNTFDSELF